MIEDEIRRLVDERVEKKVGELIDQRLVEIGVDVSTAEKKVKWQNNFAHLDKVHNDDEESRRRFRRSLVQQGVAGLFAFFMKKPK